MQKELLSVVFRLSDYDYDLPPERIAQTPVRPRDACRLLVLDRKTGTIQHDHFSNIARHLTPKDLLVLNNTRVMPARLFGQKASGGKVELLLLRELEENLWECLVRPGRRIPVGTKIHFNGNTTSAVIVKRSENGTRLVQFEGVKNFKDYLTQNGEIPFPPYVTSRQADPEEYQTVYAKEEGSVAAPTAGLHFTDELLEKLGSKGIKRAEVTLHVGWGTFRPVRSEIITDHKMEKEWYSISKETAVELSNAQDARKRIVAVGTTACRTLEGVANLDGTAKSGWSDLFITPGFQFKHVRGLITNFHLPRSTLLMLVCAFAGKDLIFKAYEEAVRMNYRFYSFGDAMLIM